MTERNCPIAALVLSATLLLMPCIAASQQAPAEDVQADEETTSSREVEISEDNYRRFMELDDQPIERAMPIMQAPQQAGLETMQRLPESSQKHLRDQLREIILGSGAWTPASINKNYPFEPSEAARTDASLRQLEATAWQELVAQYHAREAEIQAARQGGPAATTAGQSGASAGQNAGQNASGQAGGQQGQAGAEGQQAGGQQEQGSTAQASEQARRQQQSQASSSSRPGHSQYRPPPEGSEQSALEFLTDRAAGSGSRPASGRLSLEQLEQVQGIGRISNAPPDPAPEPVASDEEDDNPAEGPREGEG